MNRPIQRRRRGFTFIEIMMVVVIIGILLALVGPRLAGRTRQAKISAAKAQIENFATALAAYEMDMGAFPETSDGLKALVTKPGSDDSDSWNGPYLRKSEVPKDPWNRDYNYRFPGENNSDFDLWSDGPDRQAGNDDDVTNWSKSKE
ncbi:MAG: type II secretion system major pseudopilin GspG [Candidatus Sumerlaeia bacterium]|nr:type II secretion system major pseudopilin GspG [Candidatus Sumerlaeia bacterium]